MGQPGYFERIRARASKRWDQLEDDPELAGPWRQLFIQVQSPRQVVSELLQNADDARATDATVEINKGEFIFSHNGEDFDEEQFASLCRFGFSNKRTLHTIGFRGVGFKSTFSLGDEVRLVTPTLSVAFGKHRFTEPVLTESTVTTNGRTEVRVVIKNERIQQELAKNLQEWKESPASVLFFRNIRRLRVHEHEIVWESQGNGPILGSQWMSVSANPDERYLVIRSPEEEFPEDSLKEIRDERMASDVDTAFPRCRIEIVLGTEGRLFVVLPTGVKTQLPFACNAPFIQDPARMKIKDPELSPTNAWLLRRAGALAAVAMLAWADQGRLTLEERSQAYRLHPDVDRRDNSIEGSCGTIVEESFESTIEGQNFLLTETKTLVPSGACLAVPVELLDVWTSPQVSAGFSVDNRPLLSRYVRQRDREKLINWGHAGTLHKSQVLETLKNEHLPRPRCWRQLVRLWDYVADEVAVPWVNHSSVRIVPVQGKDVLYAANEVVRPGERRTLKPADWEFLAPYLLTLDPNWTRFLRQRRNEETSSDEVSKGQVKSAFNVLRALRLDEATNIHRIFNRVADEFFSQGSPLEIQACARLARIAAKLEANVPGKFKFVTQDREFSTTEMHPIVADVDGSLDRFVDEDWYKHNVLHDAYMQPSETCTDAEWRQWVRSLGSNLHTFVPLHQIKRSIWNRARFVEDLRRRGFDGDPYFHYRRDNFVIMDWDFDATHWQHWNSLAKDDERFWTALMTQILEQPPSYWWGATSAQASQKGTTYSHNVTQESLLPEWIIRFRNLPGLPDTWGQPRQPAELLRRAPETEPLMNIEPFVKADLDTETTRPLLELLGVRDRPTGPEPLLERLRALASINPPFVPEIQKWCHSLDQLFHKCSTEEVQEIKTAFARSRLILTDDEEWASSDEVFLNSDEDGMQGMALIHPSLRSLAIWSKIGVSERPTADIEIEWLKSLPSGRKLTIAQNRRVRRLMPAYPGQVWNECGHWVNMQGEWVTVETLAYSLTMQSLIQWNHLFPGVKAKTADFQRLSSVTCQTFPFSALPTLEGVIDQRFQGQSGLLNPQEKTWLVALGTGLQRVVLDDADQMERVRALAQRLSQTLWQVAGGLESEPYIDGTPAGTSRPIDVLWRGDILYVQRRSLAKLARIVPQEIARAFNRQDITDAIKLCYERPAKFIEEYLDDNFNLAPPNGDDEYYSLINQANLPNAAKGESIVVSHPSNVWSAENGHPGEEPLPADVINGDSAPLLPRSPRPPRPARKSLIERFAQSRGFLMNGADKFYHPNGSLLERSPESAFPWEHKSASGEILQYYWPKEHCIYRAPLQLEAEIWQLCQETPDLYSLVLTNTSGIPIELSGYQLLRMREQEELILYPATYRLVYKGEDNGQL